MRYNLPDAPAGGHIPPEAARTLRPGENGLSVDLIGPGKEQEPGAPPAQAAPFIRLGLMDWW